MQYTKHRSVYVGINIELKHSPLMNKKNENKGKKWDGGVCVGGLLLELQDSPVN